MVRLPAKFTWIQSGNTPSVASFQPPPAPQPAPDRLLSMTVAGRKPGPLVDDADATPPFEASATFDAAVRLADDDHASTSVRRDHPLPLALTMLMRMRSVVNGVNATLRLTSWSPVTVASVTQFVPSKP